jgi:hypothetical protein
MLIRPVASSSRREIPGADSTMAPCKCTMLPRAALVARLLTEPTGCLIQSISDGPVMATSFIVGTSR